ncbi:hypothetical protein [Cellulomonas sp. URHB0016]
MNRTDAIDAALRSLDPADRHVDPMGARARADLRAILATDPAAGPCLHATPRTAPAPAPAPATPRPATTPVRTVRWTTRRVALVGGLVTAVAAGMVAMPAVRGGDPAFATWTAVPTGVPAEQRPEAAADCRANLKDGSVGGDDFGDELDGAQTAIAETRGVWTTVVLTGSDGFTATCITDDSAPFFAQGSIGSIGTPTGYVPPGPREVFATSLGAGTMGAGDISTAAGAAGADVVGVVYHSRTHGDVVATVNLGQFALWFPGDELTDLSNGVDVEVTYRDGTTATSRLTL